MMSRTSFSVEQPKALTPVFSVSGIFILRS
jgi:hypothetical protein